MKSMNFSLMLLLGILSSINSIEFLSESQSPKSDMPESPNTRNLNILQYISCNSSTCQSQHWSKCDCMTPRREGNIRMSTERFPTQRGQNNVLGNLNIDCGNRLLIKFTHRYQSENPTRLLNVGETEALNYKDPIYEDETWKIWAEYECSSELAHDIKTYYTEWEDFYTGNLIYLDRQNVRCPPFMALIGFQLETKTEFFIFDYARYRYVCGLHRLYNAHNSGSYIENSNKFYADGKKAYALRDIKVSSWGNNYLAGFKMVRTTAVEEYLPCCEWGFIFCRRNCDQYQVRNVSVWMYEAYYCN